MGSLMKSLSRSLAFVGTDGSSGLRICTRKPVRLTDVVETSYRGTQGWHGLPRIFPLEFFWAASQVSRTDLV
jgi:hypothetical protein